MGTRALAYTVEFYLDGARRCPVRDFWTAFTCQSGLLSAPALSSCSGNWAWRSAVPDSNGR